MVELIETTIQSVRDRYVDAVYTNLQIGAVHDTNYWDLSTRYSITFEMSSLQPPRLLSSRCC